MGPTFQPDDLAKAAQGTGRLSRAEKRLDKLERFAANLIGGEGISIKPNARGGATIRQLGVGGGLGGIVGDGSEAFLISAEEVFQPSGQSYDPKRYNVVIRGGTAQALGQAPANFETATFEDVTAPRFFYISYDMTDFEWQEGIQSSTTLPATENPYPVVIGALDELGKRQDRLGGIEVVVTDNSVDVSP